MYMCTGRPTKIKAKQKGSQKGNKQINKREKATMWPQSARKTELQDAKYRQLFELQLAKHSLGRWQRSLRIYFFPIKSLATIILQASYFRLELKLWRANGP